MSDGSSIEWTDATWNWVTGCTRVSAGCDCCYIERTPPFRMAGRRFDTPGIGGTTGVKLHSDRLGQPLRWQKPRMVFAPSLADPFHDAVPDRFLADVFAVMSLAGRHTFQVLTKRPARARSLITSTSFLDLITQALAARGRRDRTTWPLPNLWLGVSVEDQHAVDDLRRLEILRGTPAVVRWVSVEPMLGPVDVRAHLPELDWVVCGGESGPGARPMHPAWAESLRDQCVAGRVPYFFKQWGDWAPTGLIGTGIPTRNSPVGESREIGYSPIMERVGKKAAGRELDGRTWDEYPAQVAHPAVTP